MFLDEPTIVRRPDSLNQHTGTKMMVLDLAQGVDLGAAEAADHGADLLVLNVWEH